MALPNEVRQALLEDLHGDLPTLKSSDLDALYAEAPRGGIPNGDSIGTPITLPAGTSVSRVVSHLANLGWKGKVFTRTSATHANLTNKIFGLRFGKASVDFGPSWSDDGEETVIIDYLHHSLLFWWIRDEIRLVAQSDDKELWLGRAYVRVLPPVRVFGRQVLPGKHVMGAWFVLEMNKK